MNDHGIQLEEAHVLVDRGQAGGEQVGEALDVVRRPTAIGGEELADARLLKHLQSSG